MKRTFIGPVVLIALWLGAGSLHLLNPLLIPTLPAVARSVVSLVRDGTLPMDLGLSAWRTLLSFLISSVVGVSVGLLLALMPKVRESTAALVDFFRSVPGTALFPLFLLFFGIGDGAKVANAVFASSLIIIVNTIYGVRTVSQTRIMAARTMGASSAQIYARVLFPSALPSIAGGLRLAVSIALIVIVVTEMFIGTQYGIGKRIFHAYQLFNIPDMYAAILVTGLFGYCLNAVVITLERRFVHWAGR